MAGWGSRKGVLARLQRHPRRADWLFVAAVALLLGALLLSSLYVTEASRKPVPETRAVTIDRQWLRTQQYRENIAADKAANADRWPATPPPAPTAPPPTAE